MLPIKKSGSVTMDKAGTIDYFCRFHPNMKGTINVAP
jgi:plastocyanin